MKKILEFLHVELLAPELRQKFYAQEDYHVMYYGEIVSVYLNSK